LKRKDLERNQLLEQKVQEVDLDLFARLEAGDILFIDSSQRLKDRTATLIISSFAFCQC